MNKEKLRKLLLGGKSKGSIIGDHITKPQKKAMKKQPFGDWDGDRVINGLDCRPKNKNKHGYWKPMDPDKQRQMRDDAMDKYYAEKGYYKYGGPDRMQKDDLDEGSQSFFGKNPVKRYVGMTSRIRK